MHDNVWEWCSDWYDWDKDSYANAGTLDPEGPFAIFRLMRGGKPFIAMLEKALGTATPTPCPTQGRPLPGQDAAKY